MKQKIHKVKVRYECSCGFKYSAMIIGATARQMNDGILNMVLEPHRKSGHQLREIK